MDAQTFIQIALFVPSVTESLSRIAKRRADEDLRKRATEAGYDDVDKYRSDCYKNNPNPHARQYLECVNEYGSGSTRCNRHKDRWLELKAKQNGIKLAWNEEEVHKMLKEDAIEAGYKEGYFFKKDPKYLEYTAHEYEKCIAEHGVGAENTRCKYKKGVWLRAKAYQNERRADEGYDDVDKYISDCYKNNPSRPACQYLECVNEYGSGSARCNRHKERWLELKAMQNGIKLAWNEEEVHKMLKEDAIEAGYEEGYFFKKDPKYLESAARVYEKCIAEYGVGAENTWCKYKKRVWLKAKAYQNA